jgi:hypothetical protein
MSILGYIVTIGLLAFFGFWSWAAYKLVIKK